AGPGHGKAVISGYIVADDRGLRRGLALSFAAATLQALVAIALVGTLTIALRQTAQTMAVATDIVERASFALVALVGTFMLWRKSGGLLALGHGAQAHDAACDHVHMPSPDEIAHLRNWREMSGVVLAAGLRPCAGALIILVFAASQGLLWAGIAAAFAMALGTALTTGALAALAVFFKFAALRLAGGSSLRGARALAGLELLAAAFVAVLGAALFLGLAAGGQGS
ncbi:MAG: nickel transporter, partial [Hyphomicrobiales bacterium]